MLIYFSLQSEMSPKTFTHDKITLGSGLFKKKHKDFPFRKKHLHFAMKHHLLLHPNKNFKKVNSNRLGSTEGPIIQSTVTLIILGIGIW